MAQCITAGIDVKSDPDEDDSIEACAPSTIRVYTSNTSKPNRKLYSLSVQKYDCQVDNKDAADVMAVMASNTDATLAQSRSTKPSRDDLRQRCRDLGLAISGTISQLLQRIENHEMKSQN